MTLVKIMYADSTVVIPITNPVFGGPAQIAARMRNEGLAARKVGNEVHVNGQADFTPPPS